MAGRYLLVFQSRKLHVILLSVAVVLITVHLIGNNRLDYFVNMKAHKVETNQLNVIFTFPLYTNEPVINIPGAVSYTKEKLEERMEEYITSLKKTLAHSKIHSVHLLYDQQMLPKYVRDKTIDSPEQQKKLVFHHINNSLVANAVYMYAFNKLHGELVMTCQADVYAGEGFDLIEKKRMINNTLMYALTRRTKVESKCDMGKDQCDVKLYGGSHDCYIFVPGGEFPDAAVRELNHPINSPGIDNLIIWTFRHILKYRVLNPCKVIKAYHLHCSGVRNLAAARVNGQHSGLSSPSDILV